MKPTNRVRRTATCLRLEQPGCDHFTAIHGLEDPGSRLMQAIRRMIEGERPTAPKPTRIQGAGDGPDFRTYGPAPRPIGSSGNGSESGFGR